MMDKYVNEEYYAWLVRFVLENKHLENISFDKLLSFLHNTEFRYLINRDENRAEDGVALRYRFSCDGLGIQDAESYITGPCSVLEMMVALALRCEENIMSDPRYGNRTAQWFWKMIVSLGLGGMTDDWFDEYEASYVINKFLDRRYEPNGKGGLFTIKNCDRDLRTVEIWVQMCWYLNTIC